MLEADGQILRMGINPAGENLADRDRPYAYIRHPIYALSSLLMLSTLVADPVPLMFIVAIVHLILLQLEAHREEQHLARVHGQPYLDYFGQRWDALPSPPISKRLHTPEKCALARQDHGMSLRHFRFLHLQDGKPAAFDGLRTQISEPTQPRENEPFKPFFFHS